ncbi:MAG: sugar phosphate isomerase/epimerase [Gemmatimonadetes bacterium]|nr:sugar phosphate isomerase/epimerase [Gemmatimonadota bacterium]
MFTIAVITDEVSQDLDRVIAFARDFNLDGIEIRSIWDKPPQDLDDDEIARIRDRTGEAGLAVVGVAPPFYKCDIDDDASYREHLGILRRSIRVARGLDTPLVRVFAFWKQDPLDKYWDRIVERFLEPVRIAEGEGVVLGLENEMSTMIGTGAETRRLIDALDTQVVKPLWDPCNELFDDDGHAPYPDGYNHIRSDMYHMHIKDGARGTDKKYVNVPMCEGEIDYRGQFSELVEQGYEGCVSLETHWRVGPEQIEHALLELPGGKQFSEAGEAASRICMRNTLDLLAELGVERSGRPA